MIRTYSIKTDVLPTCTSVPSLSMFPRFRIDPGLEKKLSKMSGGREVTFSVIICTPVCDIISSGVDKVGQGGANGDSAPPVG